MLKAVFCAATPDGDFYLLCIKHCKMIQPYGQPCIQPCILLTREAKHCLFLTVCRHVRCIRQVPPQRCGRGNVLGPDCAVGQQEQQEDARAEDSSVSGSTHGTPKHSTSEAGALPSTPAED